MQKCSLLGKLISTACFEILNLSFFFISWLTSLRCEGWEIKISQMGFAPYTENVCMWEGWGPLMRIPWQPENVPQIGRKEDVGMEWKREEGERREVSLKSEHSGEQVESSGLLVENYDKVIRSSPGSGFWGGGLSHRPTAGENGFVLENKTSSQGKEEFVIIFLRHFCLLSAPYLSTVVALFCIKKTS